MLYLQSGNVKEGRQKEYQAWVKENEGAIEKHAPKGWLYRGTYGTVFGFGRSATFGSSNRRSRRSEASPFVSATMKCAREQRASSTSQYRSTPCASA